MTVGIARIGWWSMGTGYWCDGMVGMGFGIVGNGGISV